jgi:hypothetical protein
LVGSIKPLFGTNLRATAPGVFDIFQRVPGWQRGEADTRTCCADSITFLLAYFHQEKNEL